MRIIEQSINNIEFQFITTDFEREIRERVINQVFPNMNTTQQTMLGNYLTRVVDVIAIKNRFDLTNREKYFQQFRQNNHQDLKGLLAILLPFIDGSANTSKIRSLNDIYVTKKIGSIQDINEGEPKYMYSNLQYGRCKRETNGAHEIVFDKSHLEQNYHLLLHTIQIASNKMYTNWMDVRPITEESAIKLFMNTQRHINDGSLPDWNPCDNSDEHGRTYNGIYIGDIYTTLAHKLFHDVKNHKWIIYDMLFNGNLIPHGVIINTIVPIDISLSWAELTDNLKDNFTIRWNGLVLAYENRTPFDILSDQQVQILIETIMIFFNKYYTGVSKATSVDGYQRFRLPNDRINEEINEDTKVKYDELLKAALSVTPQHIYNYLYETFDHMNVTWYAEYMFNQAKRRISTIQEFIAFQEEKGIYTANNFSRQITLKNFYNYAKSLTHYQDGSKYLLYGLHWRALSDDTKKEIIHRINTPNKVSSWFKITGNIRRVLNLDDNQHPQIVTEMQQYITSHIQRNIAAVAGNILLSEGLLTEFVPEADLSDESKLPSKSKDFKRWKTEIMGRLKQLVIDPHRAWWEESTYFLTSKMYGNMDPIRVNKNNTAVDLPYLDFLSDVESSLPWWSMYAMNWISQISFFHRYINNRIIYVTGGTGVGKSTQVPKLLLYALKMIDYRMDGKIVCTQPRIAPTTGNATQIGFQLGTPLQEYNDGQKKDIRTKNYYVQYKYSDGQHAKATNGLELKIVTDGSLYQELKTNPILKRQRRADDEVKFTTKNLYDIVIVDEAHEHNHNMDFILTMMKQALHYNNSLRLVIISATMDDDEPTYRRYYRDINDNKLYPFDTILSNNNLDRINVDRRLHISPPGQTTSFTIDDIYKPNADPEEIVLQIARRTTSGDILLFQPGQGEIIRSVELLNQKLPANMIALPFYSQLPKDKRNFIENLNDNTKRQLTIPRGADFAKDDSVDRVPPGTYTRVVIVATNIAEASITISTLEYVVDTGTQKTNEYDYRTRLAKLKVTHISESSRMQRRGRVGRTRSGTVYYLYEEDAMENNKIQFNISVLNIADNMFDLVRASENDGLLISHDPNIKLSYDDVQTKYTNGYEDVVHAQYFIGTEYVNYIGNTDQYDYKLVTPMALFESGYDYNTLLDHYGTFYIVHPDELSFNRDITGRIISATSEVIFENNKIMSPKIKSFFDSLEELRFMITNIETMNRRKTEFGLRCKLVSERLKLTNVKVFLAYLYSRIYGVGEDMLKVIPAMEMLIGNRMSLSMFATDTVLDNKRTNNIEQLKSIYGNAMGDIHAIIKIANDALQFLSTKVSLQSTRDARLDRIDRLHLEEAKEYYLSNKNTRVFNSDRIDDDILDKFLMLDGSGKLHARTSINDLEIDEFVKNDINVDIIINKLEEHQESLERWARSRSLNIVTLTRYLKHYVSLVNKIAKYDRDLFDIDYEADRIDVDFEWFRGRIEVVPTMNNDKALTRSLLHGFGYHIARRIDRSKLYTSIIDPTVDNVWKIKMVGWSQIPDTLFTQLNTSQYVVFLSMDETEIALLHYITPPEIQIAVSDIYTPTRYLPKTYDIGRYQRTITQLIASVSSGQKPKLQTRLVSDYMHTVQSIKMDMVQNYDSDVWRRMEKLDDDPTYRIVLHQQKRAQHDAIAIFSGQNGGTVLNDNIEQLNSAHNNYTTYLIQCIWR